MKEHWQRPTPYVELTADQLTAMIAPAFPSARVLLHEILPGGLANTLYKVQLHNFVQPIVVRLYTRDPAACQKDVDLFNRVQNSVPVPRIFYADPGGAAHGLTYAITEWVAGATLRDVLKRGDQRDQAQAMHAAGATLAALGKHTFERGGFFGPALNIVQPLHWNAGELQWYIADRVQGHARAILGASLSDRLHDFVQRYAPLLQTLPITNALVHADYNEPNIVMRQDGDRWAVAAVLDWEFACSGPPLYDMGVMLRNDERRPEAFADNFVQGFTGHGGALPDQWRAIIKLLDLINLCDFLSKATVGDPMARDITALMARTIARVDRQGAA